MFRSATSRLRGAYGHHGVVQHATRQVFLENRRGMAQVTAAMVKELRDLMGAPMMQCKKALTDPEVNGDMKKAEEWLRKQGVEMAKKKADRVTNDGLIGVRVSSDLKQAAIVEVASETDFVARNEVFQDLVSKINEVALQNASDESLDLAKLLVAPLDGSATVEDALVQGTANLGENIGLKCIDILRVNHGIIGSYIHNKRSEESGTMGALVAVEASEPLKDDSAKEQVANLAQSLAMHLVGGQAMFLDGVPDSVMEKERELELERLVNEAKEKAEGPVDEDVLAKRAGKKVEKLLKKMQTEQVLLDQEIVSSTISGEKVSKVLNSVGKDIGNKLAISKAVRFQIGVENQAILESIKK